MEKNKFHHFRHPLEKFWKNPLVPSPWKISFRHPWLEFQRRLRMFGQTPESIRILLKLWCNKKITCQFAINPFKQQLNNNML